jgi:hypothetical protein
VLDVRLDHDPQRQLLQVRQLRHYERLRVAPVEEALPCTKGRGNPALRVSEPDTMPLSRRARRRLIVLSIVALSCLYLSMATWNERRRIAAEPRAAAPAEAVAHSVDRSRLMSDVRRLADPGMQGRRTGTEGGRRARAFIEQRMREIGLQPAGATYAHPFAFVHHSIKGLLLPGRPFKIAYDDAANVVGSLPPSCGRAREAPTDTGGPLGCTPPASDRALVVSAHYDHLGVRDGVVYPGADDNASGVAALLAAAAAVAGAPRRHEIVFVAFDAEELGLKGSEAYVRDRGVSPQTVAAIVNLDMGSRSDSDEIFVVGPGHTPAPEPIVSAGQRRAAVNLLRGHERPMLTAGFVEDWTQSSDHGPFADAGVPFLYFGVEDHADYHAPGDTADKINPVFFGNVADAVVEAVKALDASVP